jgi:hypothetical protein
VADSSQKILKELSDLTRNLDVLAKEIRSMNKNTASVQDAVVKSVEKKEATSDKAENKTPTTDPQKVISETKKSQDSMFSKFLETFKKSSEAGNNEIRKAGLEGIKNAGKTLLETKSLKDAAKSGLSGFLKSSAGSIVESIKRKKEEKNATLVEGVTSTEGLKKKEKSKKEEPAVAEKESSEKKVKEAEKKEKKSILEKLNIKKKSKEEKIKAEKEKTSEEKTEKKGLLSRLREKISERNSKKEDALTNTGKEKIDQKDSTPTNSQEKKEPPSLKSLDTSGISKEKSTIVNNTVDSSKEKSTVLDNSKDALKEKAKQIFQKTTLGATINGVSNITKKKKSENSSSPSSIENKPGKLTTKSKIEKVGTELKARLKGKKKESPTKEKSETPVNKETPAPAMENKSMESKEPEKISGSKSEEKKNESSKDKKPEISAQDIAEIKVLLASINSTLNSPLNIKDNKPYRPQSNMLNEF